MFSHSSRLSMAAAIITLGAAAGCNPGVQPSTSGDSVRDPNAPPVVKVVSPESIVLSRTTTQPATVHAYFEARIDAKVDGYVKTLNVDIGDRVESDSVLAVIDVPEMLKQMEYQEQLIVRLRANETRAKAEVHLAAANVTAAEASVQQSQADVLKAAARLNASRLDYERILRLVNAGTIEAQLRDQAQEEYESSTAEKTAAEASVAFARANVDVKKAQHDAAVADLKTAQSEIVLAQKRLEEYHVLMNYAELKAPFAGVVTSRHIDPGDLVQKSGVNKESERSSLLTVAMIDKVRVRIAVPEDDAPWVDPGDQVTIRLRSLKGQAIEGEISRLDEQLDPATRTMIAEVEFENIDHRLLPGMYGEATILLEEKPDAKVLPAGAVRFDSQGNSFAYVVQEGDEIEVVSLELGVDDGNHIEVLAGLDDGARVVDAMVGRLESGQKVVVEN